MKPILCLDFDGVIHSYTSGWKGADQIPDLPVPGAIEFICVALPHFEVHVYSSRSSQLGGINAMQAWLADAFFELMLPEMAESLFNQIIWPTQKPTAFLSIDDRAITFDGDWYALIPTELLKFKPWNKR